ncbi:MAG: hypothetical protein DRQ99_15305 [Candidatus Parabeggiatoa sp. nov. 3]|nr:MAG: hypothetical protein DRQ99_15305 [Gammaproteobacteria bacterium]
MENWIDIFKTGLQTSSSGDKEQWTEEKLDEIISNFGQLDQNEVPVVIGHPKMDSPAYGWVDKIRRVKNKLQVKFRDLVPEFITGVKEKRWPNRSIRLAHTDKGWRLIHVGFLGAAAPAVKGLKPIYNADITQYEDYKIMPDNDITNNDIPQTNEPIADYNSLIKLMKQQKQEFTEKLSQLEKSVNSERGEGNSFDHQQYAQAITNLQTQNQTLEAEIVEERRNRILQQFSAEVASYPNLLAPQIEGLAEFMCSLGLSPLLEFSYLEKGEGEKGQVLKQVNQLDFFRSFLKTLPPFPSEYLFSEVSAPPANEDSDNPLMQAVEQLVETEFGGLK